MAWNSSVELDDVNARHGYLVNERLYLVYIASGMIPAQYKKFFEFACIGTVRDFGPKIFKGQVEVLRKLQYQSMMLIVCLS